MASFGITVILIFILSCAGGALLLLYKSIRSFFANIVSGLSESDPAGCVVAFCLPEHHKGKGVTQHLLMDTSCGFHAPQKGSPVQDIRNIPFRN